MPLSFNRSSRSQRLGCLFPFYSLRIRWITLIAEVAQIKIFQLCDFLEQRVLWVDVKWATIYQLQNRSGKRPDDSGASCWEKITLNIKSFNSLPVIALRKHIQIKGWGISHCFETIFFSIARKAFIVCEILCSLFSVGPLTFKRDWKHADKKGES